MVITVLKRRLSAKEAVGFAVVIFGFAWIAAAFGRGDAGKAVAWIPVVVIGIVIVVLANRTSRKKNK